MLSNTEHLLTNGLVALANGNKDTARAALSKVVTQEPRNVLGWLYLSATLPRDGAIQVLRRVLILEPDNPVALRNLERLRRTDIELDFFDVCRYMQDIDVEAEATLPSLLDNERTVNIKQYTSVAEFGDETGTLPYAFFELLRAQTAYRPTFSEPPVPVPTPAKVAPEKTPTAVLTPPPARLDPAWIKRDETLAPEVVPTAKPKPAPKAPPSYNELKLRPAAEPEKPPAPVVRPTLSARHRPLIQAAADAGAEGYVDALRASPNYLPAQPRRLPQDYVPRAPVKMPRLQDKPRYQLGESPAPVFGITGFGVLLLLATFIATLVIVFSLLSY
jgi:hypothetical protein